MPELPEVETIRRVLASTITGSKITQVFLKKTRMIRNQSVLFLKKGLINRQILTLDRRGKNLIFRLDDINFLVHLGMSGQIISFSEKNCAGKKSLSLPDKHIHLILRLNNGMTLYFRDPRMFGRYVLLNSEEENILLSKLGPEPLGLLFTPAGFYQNLRGRTASIKALLLNQKIVAGLGNIYVDESLFRAGIHPATPGGRISKKRAERLFESIQTVITKAVNAGGTSISDFQDPEQRTGNYQHFLNVYGRKGQACLHCGTSIIKETLAQRGTHWCPNCQR